MTQRKNPNRQRPPRAPQDRLPKAEAMGGKITVEVRGISITVDPESLDDYDAVTSLGSGFPEPFLRALVPDDAVRAALLDTCKDENGRRKLSTVMEMTAEIAQAVGAGN